MTKLLATLALSDNVYKIPSSNLGLPSISGGNTSHKTNLMFVQEETWAGNGHFAIEIPSRDKKQKVRKKHTATFSYQSRKRGNPEGNLQFNVRLTTDASVQRRRMFLHALIRSSGVNRIPPADPSYSGFYTSLTKPLTKHKAYYHGTLPNPPTKGVVYDIMQRCKQAAEERSMQFIQVIGDQPVYALIAEVKNENQGDFENILPVLVGFHTQGAFMNTVYRRFKGSGLEDLAVAAGIVEAGFADQALKGKHYKRGMRLHKLMYKCLAKLLISSTTDDIPTLYSELTQLNNQVFDSDQYIDAFEDLFTNANSRI